MVVSPMVKAMESSIAQKVTKPLSPTSAQIQAMNRLRTKSNDPTYDTTDGAVMAPNGTRIGGKGNARTIAQENAALRRSPSYGSTKGIKPVKNPNAVYRDPKGSR